MTISDPLQKLTKPRAPQGKEATLNKKAPNSEIEAPEKLQTRSSKGFPFIMAVIASVLLVLSLKLPLWHIRLESPQYKDEEALKIAVYPNAMKGDLRELKVLNQYIGVHVPPTLPQFTWLPWAIATAAGLGFVVVFLNRKIRSKALIGVVASLVIALAIAAIQARFQMHDIGHKRDHKTILAGMHDFTPPFLGTTRIAQFTVSSRFGSGAWLIGGTLGLQLGAAWLSRKTVAADGTRIAIDSPQKGLARSEACAPIAGARISESQKAAATINPPPHVGGCKTVTT